MSTASAATAAWGSRIRRRHSRATSHACFCADQDALESDFTTFIAVFRGPEDADEPTFEPALWQQLRALYARDEEDYSDEVSPNPESSHFGFSFAGRAFFVVGLRPNSTRIARASTVPRSFSTPTNSLKSCGRQGAGSACKR